VYGLDRLDRSAATADARQRHAAYFLAFAERAGSGLRGQRQSEWLARLHTEHGNLRVALDWCLRQADADAAMRMAGALYQFWDWHGHYTEGRGWLGRALAAAGRPVPSAPRVRALLAYGGLAAMQGDLREAAEIGGQAADLCHQAGDAGGSAHALQFLGFVAICGGELDRATDLLIRASRDAQAADRRWLQGRSLLFLAIAALGRADYDSAVRAATDGAEILLSAGDADSVAGTLIVQATVAWRRHELDQT
jgi:non-specific serine/threonine protein kinase